MNADIPGYLATSRAQVLAVRTVFRFNVALRVLAVAVLASGTLLSSSGTTFAQTEASDCSVVLADCRLRLKPGRTDLRPDRYRVSCKTVDARPADIYLAPWF